jgi:hypothetical protein
MSLPCRRAEDKLKERIVWIENFIEVRANQRVRGVGLTKLRFSAA